MENKKNLKTCYFEYLGWNSSRDIIVRQMKKQEFGEVTNPGSNGAIKIIVSQVKMGQIGKVANTIRNGSVKRVF